MALCWCVLRVAGLEEAPVADLHHLDLVAAAVLDGPLGRVLADVGVGEVVVDQHLVARHEVEAVAVDLAERRGLGGGLGGVLLLVRLGLRLGLALRRSLPSAVASSLAACSSALLRLLVLRLRQGGGVVHRRARRRARSSARASAPPSARPSSGACRTGRRAGPGRAWRRRGRAARPARDESSWCPSPESSVRRGGAPGPGPDGGMAAGPVRGRNAAGRMAEPLTSMHEHICIVHRRRRPWRSGEPAGQGQQGEGRDGRARRAAARRGGLPGGLRPRTASSAPRWRWTWRSSRPPRGASTRWWSGATSTRPGGAGPCRAASWGSPSRSRRRRRGRWPQGRALRALRGAALHLR